MKLKITLTRLVGSTEIVIESERTSHTDVVRWTAEDGARYRAALRAIAQAPAAAESIAVEALNE